MSSFTFSVVSHGHGNLLAALLGDLDADPALKGAKIVVTLNIPEEFTATAWPKLDITLLRNAAPKGFGANHNAAFGHCTTRWFVILNPDLRLIDSEPFTALATAAVQVPALGAIAPRICNSGGGTEDSVRANLTPWSLVRRRFLGERAPVQADMPSRIGQPFYWLAGMCLMFDAAVYRGIGGFDQRFFLYGEDYDISARLYDRGLALAVLADVAVLHDAQRDSHRSLRHLYWHLGSILRIWASPVFWRITLGRSRAMPDPNP